jgi:hypothetical protein
MAKKKKQKFYLGVTMGAVQKQVIIKAKDKQTARIVMASVMEDNSEFRVERIKLEKNAVVSETTTLRIDAPKGHEENTL